MQKKIYLHDFIFLLERVQYLSKIGRNSIKGINRGKATGIKTTHQITHDLKVHITPIFSVALFSILKRSYSVLNSENAFDKIFCN